VANLVDDHLRRAALFGAADGWNDAIRAKLVAADLNPHVRLKRRRTHFRVAQRVKTFMATGDLGAAAVAATEADFHLLAFAALDPLD
jgi:hypothetical protein